MVVVKSQRWKKIKDEQRGSILPFTIVILAILALWAMVAIRITTNSFDGIEAKNQQLQAFYLSEGAMNEGLALLQQDLQEDNEIDITGFNRHQFFSDQSLGKVTVSLTEQRNSELDLTVTSVVGETWDKRQAQLVLRQEQWYPSRNFASLTTFQENEIQAAEWIKNNQQRNNVIELANSKELTLAMDNRLTGYLHLKPKPGLALAKVKVSGNLTVPELIVEGNLVVEGMIDAERITVTGDFTVNQGSIDAQLIQAKGDVVVAPNATINGELHIEGNLTEQGENNEHMIVIQREIQPGPVKTYIYPKGVVLSYQGIR